MNVTHDRLSADGRSSTLRRVVGLVAGELQIEAGSRDHAVLAEKAATLSLAFPDEGSLLDLLRRSARILLKRGSAAEE